MPKPYLRPSAGAGKIYKNIYLSKSHQKKAETISHTEQLPWLLASVAKNSKIANAKFGKSL